jgi:hypothetical protein
MSYQAYLDNIKVKTGKTPEDFKRLAANKGLLASGIKAGEIVAWLKQDFGLGHGHAMAIVCELQQNKQPDLNDNEKTDAHFNSKKAMWREPYNLLFAEISKFGADVRAVPGGTYISLLRGGKKFGIVQVSSERVDVGIKFKGIPPVGRLEESANWNTMVTHRVRITDPTQFDSELISWLNQAYERAS